MLTIIHTRLGDPVTVLTLADRPAPGAPAAGQALVRMRYAPIHYGDLLGVEGSPAFGAPPPIPESGRTPGFEGVGVIDALGEGSANEPMLRKGQRVMLFPVAGAWSEWVLASQDSLVPVPAGVSDETAAQVLINTVTASMVVRAGQAKSTKRAADPPVVIQTGAGSAVGKLVTALLVRSGVSPLRLVRTPASAKALSDAQGPVFATDDHDWVRQARQWLDGRSVTVALDGVGGRTLGGVAELLAEAGSVISYGSLGGETSDIRLFAPKRLELNGVVIGRWRAEAPEVREADLRTALELALSGEDLFPVAGVYPPTDVHLAVEHVRRPGRTGNVLIRF